jgi:putative MATE family efflux protein
VAGTALGASVGFSFIIALLGWFFSAQMLHLLQTPELIFADANLYTKVIFAMMPLFFPAIMYTTFLRGVGDSKTPLYFLIIGAICGILFTPALIAGWFGLPKVGVIAPALAGGLTQLVILPTMFIYLRATNHPLQFTMETARDMLVDPKLLWLILKIGIPTGLAMIVVSIAEIAVVGFVNRFGADATAAYGAVNQIIGYVQFPAMSLSIAASIFGAQCIGARREDMLGKVVRSAVALNYIVNGALILLCYIFASEIIGLFITDPNVVQVARGLLGITLWSYLLWGNSAVLSGVMRSSGSVLWPTINSMVAVIIVEVPSAYILMQHYGLSGVWMGYPIAYAFVLSAQFVYYEFFWKKKTHERLI